MKLSHIRNFAIIAHIDHGKSTLSDRLLEITHTIAKDKLQEQFLDQNPISRERGITIKLAPVRMKYIQDDQEYELNLIDTPGHVDFSYEVSRTLAACEGAVLLVDATQGIQAQTVAHFFAAKKEGLVMIPVINKIDLPNAMTEAVVKELTETFKFHKDEIIFISAKTGENVATLLEKVVEKIPPPEGDTEGDLRALIFDAVYDEYRGVVSYVRVIDGKVKKGDKVRLFQSDVKTDVTDVGYFSPYLASADSLGTGEIGYIISGIKNIREARVGDTIIEQNSTAEALPGYTTPKPMVFFGVYPKTSDQFAHLRDSLGKLSLNDTALTFSEEYSAYLGSGFRVGFLGLLHAEIVKQRLQQEFDLDLLLTMPQVLYEKTENSINEPYMLLTIYSPVDYVGGIMTVCQKRKGSLLDVSYHESYATLSYEMPYTMFIRGLSAEIKSISSGYGSIDYELTDYRPADVKELEVRINDSPIDVLSELVYTDEANYIAREKASKLKDALPRQQFRQIIQSVVDGVIMAREEIPPFRKDVLQKLYGGDRTRKDKLLEAQKKGKSRMIQTGKVVLPQEALFSLIES
ncbi:MAG: translation elongation factor 4 [Candidatus Levybacteria bacterium]|nr:translation elongation factor 4 [Candidatus Levybacteria bacterium]